MRQSSSSRKTVPRQGLISMPRVGKKLGAREREKRKKREKEGKERERNGEKKINFLSPDASLALRRASLILDMFTNRIMSSSFVRSR